MWNVFPPTEDDRKRITDYERYETLYRTRKNLKSLSKNFPLYLGAILASGDRRKIAIIVNYAGVVSRVSADLLFGEAPVFTIQGTDQQPLNDLLRQNLFHRMCYESALTNSFRGDAVFRVRLDNTGEKPRVVIEDIPASRYFANLDPNNSRNVLSETIAWDVQVGNLQFLRTETHVPGYVFQDAYLLQKSGDFNPPKWQIVQQMPLEAACQPGETVPLAIQHTGVQESLLVHIPNYRYSPLYYGISDYDDLETLFEGVNNRFSKIDSYLDRHSAPKLVSLPGLVNPDGTMAQEDLEYIEANSELAKELPRYVTWDGQMGSSFQELDELADAIFKVSEIAPAVFGLDKAGSIESGRAMHMRFIRTLAKIARKRLYYDPGLKKVIRIALDLMKFWVPETPDVSGDVEITWRDGIPNDVLEVIQAEEHRVIAGLTSRENAIRRIDSVGSDAAVEELQKMHNESVTYGFNQQWTGLPETGNMVPVQKGSPNGPAGQRQSVPEFESQPDPE